MARASNGTPAKTRGENAATGLGRVVTQRVHAIVGQVFDELEKRAKGGKGDIVKMIADYVEGQPMTGLERLTKLLPQEPSDMGNTVNIPMMFLQAVQFANGHTAGGKIATGHGEHGLRVIEATTHPAINNASDDQW